MEDVIERRSGGVEERRKISGKSTAKPKPLDSGSGAGMTAMGIPLDSGSGPK
jgi:hypothetical protein